MPGEVFISYAHADRAQVSSLLTELKAAGVPVWVDERGIAGGVSWAREITAAIAGCRVLIVALSAAAAASKNVQTEVALAHSEEKPILPVALEPVELPGDLKYYLAKIHRIDLHQGAREERIGQLLSSLEHFGVEVRAGNRCADRGDGPPSPDAPLSHRLHPPAVRSPAGLRIAILYRRNAAPDERLLHLLQERLASLGHSLFIDRHLLIGVEWAREIERQVRTADAVIPLLSAASVGSEMLVCEIEIAHEARQAQAGRPRLLPVRVQYSGPLPEPLAAILDPLEYASWSGPADDTHLVLQIEQALRGKERRVGAGQAARLTATLAELEAIGGAVPLESRFYVERETDAQFLADVARGDSIVLLKGARQMGKTSLLARGLQQAREQGAKVVKTDFQKLNAQHLQSIDALFLKLAESIADQLDLDVPPEECWQPRRGPSENFERYWQRQALQSVREPVVWGLDEVDRLFTCPYASEVFGLLRSWHNERALDPDGPWKRLTLAIAYATEAHLFITDVNQSPFNVGTRLTLEDFTLEQVADLNGRYGQPLETRDELLRFTALVGGHPYLVRCGLQEMALHGVTLAALESTADRDDGLFGDHLRRILVLLAKDPLLCDVARGVLRGEPCPTPESFYRLRSAGVLAGESARDPRPRCRLYRNYLSQHLL